MRLLIFSIFLAFLGACRSSSADSTREKDVYNAPSHHISSLTSLFDAHGGFEKWVKMNTLSYVKGQEKTITNLLSREIRLESPDKTIGFDGKQVWVYPDSIDASRARFYHNLYFYFYAMPFVVGDPGAYYEEVPPMMIQGKSFDGIKVSYNEGVGDASDDNYILWKDPATDQMEWLMYTVTYRSGEPNDNYRLIHYKNWGIFNGLMLPTSLQWYHYDGDSIGGPRGDEVLFEAITIEETSPEKELFKMPKGAVVAPR